MTSTQAAQYYRYSTYTVRAKVLKLFGGSFDIFGPDGDMVLHASQKAFRLKEDIRLYRDKSKTQELLIIKAREMLDFSAAYDVQDATTNETLGAFRRKGWKSLLRDKWLVMDATGKEIGTIEEDSAWLGMLRRVMAFFVINLVPQNYRCQLGDSVACTFKQNFNPFVKKIRVDFPEMPAFNTVSLDRRMGLAAAVLLCAIEGKQS
jgi:hypothetical protein